MKTFSFIIFCLIAYLIGVIIYYRIQFDRIKPGDRLFFPCSDYLFFEESDTVLWKDFNNDIVHTEHHGDITMWDLISGWATTKNRF